MIAIDFISLVYKTSYKKQRNNITLFIFHLNHIFDEYIMFKLSTEVKFLE